jgi:hypothetical protein
MPEAESGYSEEEMERIAQLTSVAGSFTDCLLQKESVQLAGAVYGALATRFLTSVHKQMRQVSGAAKARCILLLVVESLRGIPDDE